MPDGNIGAVFCLEPRSAATYIIKSHKKCSGDVPPPVQALVACVAAEAMFVCGGDELTHINVLDIEALIWRMEPSIPNTPEPSRPRVFVFLPYHN